MAVTVQNLPEIRVGRDWIINVSEKTPLGNPLPLNGYVIELCIKQNISDADNRALFKSDSLFSPNLQLGTYSFWIPNATTVGYASYGPEVNYEIIYKDPNGFTQTRFAGTIPITPSITTVVP
jgi:hypothetical protein